MTQPGNSGNKGVIFSGMRPTGLLHLGNYMGALQNWVALQEDYYCIYCAVDIHALTTLETGEEVNEIKPNIEDMVLDWLAAGIDPEKSIVFVQSHVPEVMTLNTLLSMVTPLGWLTRVPTFKDKVRQMHVTEETVNYGLVGYPVLQTADIILYKADTVPVGQDQVPHIELSREIVRRFNNMFGETFPEPQAKLTEAPLILGLDGQSKMSKTLDNHLDLAAAPACPPPCSPPLPRTLWMGPLSQPRRPPRPWPELMRFAAGRCYRRHAVIGHCFCGQGLFGIVVSPSAPASSSAITVVVQYRPRLTRRRRPMATSPHRRQLHRPRTHPRFRISPSLLKNPMIPMPTNHLMPHPTIRTPRLIQKIPTILLKLVIRRKASLLIFTSLPRPA